MDEITTALDLARRGKRILWVEPTGAERTETLRAMERVNAPGLRRVYRTNGKQRIEFASGGEIRLIVIGHGAERGRTADCIFARPSILTNERHRAELAPCLATGNPGHVYSTFERIS